MKPTMAYVLTKAYHKPDAGFTVVRVYLDPQRAQEDHVLAQEDSSMEWILHAVEIVGTSVPDVISEWFKEFSA